jgi:hypothetical protein
MYRNFIQGNNAQKRIWSTLLQTSTQEDYKEIYFILLWALLYFLWILEVCTNFCRFKRKRKIKTVHSVRLRTGPMPQAQGCGGLSWSMSQGWGGGLPGRPMAMRQWPIWTSQPARMSYPVFMSKPSTHRMHDTGSIVPHIRPKVLTDNQMS